MVWNVGELTWCNQIAHTGYSPPTLIQFWIILLKDKSRANSHHNPCPHICHLVEVECGFQGMYVVLKVIGPQLTAGGPMGAHSHPEILVNSNIILLEGMGGIMLGVWNLNALGVSSREAPTAIYCWLVDEVKFGVRESPHLPHHCQAQRIYSLIRNGGSSKSSPTPSILGRHGLTPTCANFIQTCFVTCPKLYKSLQGANTWQRKVQRIM